MKKIKKALISVYNKSEIIPLAKLLNNNNIEIISTGGTKKILEKSNIPVQSVEEITDYPSILGGRVKTLHPKIFGGILSRTDNQDDIDDLLEFNINAIDMIVVDLYPFQETIKHTNNNAEIIEKIDIGGVSLIRSGAKNYKEILVVPSCEQLQEVIDLLSMQNGCSSLNDRLYFAKQAFNITANYELSISNYFDCQTNTSSKLPNNFKHSIINSKQLRYGENPHQEGIYYGNLSELFEKLNGKELSYNNLLDIDAAMKLMDEFKESCFGIFKHNNACGFAAHNKISTAWDKALEADPISAFGGVLITNEIINIKTAQKIHKLFFEILIAKSFDSEALDLLKSKKNRIILKKKNAILEEVSFRTILNGVLCQQRDYLNDQDDTKLVSNLNISKTQMRDLLFASKICKHTKSNAIVLVKDKQLLGSGCGQTSRIDALNQAITKAKHFGFSLENAVMASDAFFPFPDCVEIAGKEGINAIIQPGGSKNDQLSIDYCNNNNIGMIFTGNRHFKH